ncbi:MAG: lysine--tRNA ligase [Legionellales bacterium]|nr:lysine--tRNA ligase [Legionellales bacterium]
MQTDEMNVSLDENEIIAIRKKKLSDIKEKGLAFPNTFKRDSYSQDLLDKFANLSNEELEQKKIFVNVAGRIRLKRVMGKASFLQIQDPKGAIQVYVRKDDFSGDYENFKTWDLGDIVGANGILFKTKTGELTVKVVDILLLVKSVRPLPDKFHGLSDTEMRYRMRYVDLIMNDNSRKTFLLRSQITSTIREFFINKKFLEVETPMMQSIPGGAAAKPFTTHHNALDMPLFLRIAPELYLKRLIVGGFERVFELNRNFRNEGVSTQHNPEFTMLEFYMAYHDYHDLMDLTEELMQKLVSLVSSNGKLTYQGHELIFNKPFDRMTIKEAVVKYNSNITQQNYNDRKNLLSCAKILELDVHNDFSLGELQYLIFENTVEDKLINPTFITEFPTDVSPLARKNDQNPSVTDRFELFICGKEIANGFSELNDPIDQAERFTRQVQARDRGDDEAMLFDADYIKALEYGMPPTAGEGIGIDRLVMILTNSASIRDVLLFPLMRNK